MSPIRSTQEISFGDARLITNKVGLQTAPQHEKKASTAGFSQRSGALSLSFLAFSFWSSSPMLTRPLHLEFLFANHFGCRLSEHQPKVHVNCRSCTFALGAVVDQSRMKTINKTIIDNHRQSQKDLLTEIVESPGLQSGQKPKKVPPHRTFLRGRLLSLSFCFFRMQTVRAGSNARSKTSCCSSDRMSALSEL